MESSAALQEASDMDSGTKIEAPLPSDRARERQRAMCPEPLPFVVEGTRSIERLKLRLSRPEGPSP
jgi:hypothetical protein